MQSIIGNKIKKQLVSRRKIASPCCGDRDRSRDVRRSHSPLKLEPLEAGGRGRSWCRCFLDVARCVVVVCCGKYLPYRMILRRSSRYGMLVLGTYLCEDVILLISLVFRWFYYLKTIMHRKELVSKKNKRSICSRSGKFCLLGRHLV